MSIPITGLVLIPLGFLLILLPWRYCLAGLAVYAMFSAGAVVNAGGLGLQPGYFLALLMIGRTAFEVMKDQFTLNASVLSRMWPLLYLVVVVFVVLFLALCFFQGSVETLPGTSGFKSNATRPFELARENGTQLFYLVLNVLLVYVLGHQGARRSHGEMVKAWDFALCLGLMFSAGVCIWQFVSSYSAVPFLPDFFYSNAGYARADSQTMVGMVRISGPFEEPATVGYVFTGYLLFAWQRFCTHQTPLSTLMIMASVFCALVSTSTTAFLGIFLFVCVAAFDVVTGRVHLLSRNFRVTSGWFAVIAAMCLGVIGGVLIMAENWPAIEALIRTTVLEKGSGTSFQERSFADSLATRIFVETYGVGVGLGSHKANSLVLTLLSNTGLVGAVLFGTFLLSLLRPVRPAPGQRAADVNRAFVPFQWALGGLLLIHVFSNPNLSSLILWVQMGGLLALRASLRQTNVAAQRPAPPQEAIGGAYRPRAGVALATNSALARD